MYRIVVTEPTVSIGHQLILPYDSKCNNSHGHNYTIEIVLVADQLDDNGMVCDFSVIKNVINQFDHRFIGSIEQMDAHGSEVHIPEVNPSTAETFAMVLYTEVQRALNYIGKHMPGRRNYAYVESVSLWETPNNKVTYVVPKSW
jgi:6-pyruvoyl tetrahydropterin synthase/QueD family protein